MDVVAGLTPGGTCLDEKGPSIKMWLQRHPSNRNQFINVLILERHLSKELVQEIEASLDDVRFSNYKTSQAFLRFVTDMPFGDTDVPHATFGHEASSAWKSLVDISTTERKILGFTRWLYNCLDEGLQKAENALIEHLDTVREDDIPSDYVTWSEARADVEVEEAKGADGGAIADDDVDDQRHCTPTVVDDGDDDDDDDDGAEGDPASASAVATRDDPPRPPVWDFSGWWMGAKEFPFPKWSFPTSLIWFLSNGKTYGNHHDATKSNHDQRFEHQCAEQMRIASTCVAGSSDGTTEVPEGQWGIRHGLPKHGGGGLFGDVEGFWTNDGDEPSFVVKRLKGRKPIPMGTRCHTHFQPWNSQKPVHHFISSKAPPTDIDFWRAVASPRDYLPYRTTTTQYIEDMLIPVHEVYRFRKVVSTLKGLRPVQSSADLQEGAEEEAHEEMASIVPSPRAKQPSNKRPRLMHAAADAELIKPEPETHETEPFQAEELTQRDAVVGMQKSTSADGVLRSGKCAMHFYRMGVTAKILGSHGPRKRRTEVYSGPAVTSSGDYLLKPGTHLGEGFLDTTYGIKSNNRNSKVINIDAGGDVINLRHPGKNSSSVMTAINTALKKVVIFFHLRDAPPYFTVLLRHPSSETVFHLRDLCFT